jgi:hypothetical protein
MSEAPPHDRGCCECCPPGPVRSQWPACSLHTWQLEAVLADHSNNIDNRIAPFVVGVSGHRDLHPECVAGLRTEVIHILQQLRDRLPNSEVRLMAGMATGADLLVAQVALEMRLGVDAMLPMPLEQYASDFDRDSFDLLTRVLAHPGVRFVELPSSAREGATAAAAAAGISPRDANYSALTRTLIRGCSMLIALWDGESSVLPGGTADTVLRYLDVRTDRNQDDAAVKFSEAAPDHELPGRLVYWIPAARAKSKSGPAARSAAPCFLAGRSDNALLRIPSIPRRLEVHLRSLSPHY